MFDNVKFIHGGKFVSRGEWIHPERVIDSTEIILVTKGSVFISNNGMDYALSPGDVLRLDEGIRHGGYKKSHDVSFYWVHFTGAVKEELPPAYLHPDNTFQAELIYRQLLHYANTYGYPRESSDYLVRILLMELSAQNLKSSRNNNSLCSSLCEWIRVNSDLNLKVSDVAKHFNYNEDYINRVFRQFYPQGLKAFINAKRMDAIKKELINSSDSLQQISSRFSFSDYKYFLKFFKYHEGISPTAYRQLYYNIHTNNK